MGIVVEGSQRSDSLPVCQCKSLESWKKQFAAEAIFFFFSLLYINFGIACFCLLVVCVGKSIWHEAFFVASLFVVREEKSHSYRIHRQLSGKPVPNGFRNQFFIFELYALAHTLTYSQPLTRIHFSLTSQPMMWSWPIALTSIWRMMVDCSPFGQTATLSDWRKLGAKAVTVRCGERRSTFPAVSCRWLCHCSRTSTSTPGHAL